MFTLNLSAGLIYSLGIVTGVILTIVGIVVIALISNAKSKKK